MEYILDILLIEDVAVVGGSGAEGLGHHTAILNSKEIEEILLATPLGWWLQVLQS